MFKILVFEDTPSEAKALIDCIERYSREHGEHFQVTWARSAFGIAEDAKQADLIFMDIEMPGISGMDAANLLRAFDRTTPLIFVTNLAQFAVEGYEVDALGFIVKPVSYSSFSLRMAKALPVMRANMGHTVTIKVQGGLRILRVEDITFVEVRNHALTYHLDGGEEVTTRSTITEAEKTLEDYPFVRISKSYLVNMRHVSGYRGQEVTLFSGETLAMGRTMRAAAVERMTSYLGSLA